MFIALLGLLLICLEISCDSENNEDDAPFKSKVSLILNDSVVKLNNNFEIELKEGEKIFASKIIGDTLFCTLSKNTSDKQLQITLKRDTVRITINNVPGFLFSEKHPADLIFGVADRRYFDTLGLILIRDSLRYHAVKRISYLTIEPLNNGIARIYKTYLE